MFRKLIACVIPVAAVAVAALTFSSSTSAVAAQKVGVRSGGSMKKKPGTMHTKRVLPRTTRPQYRPNYRPEHRPSYRPEHRPSYRPEHRPSYRPVARPLVIRPLNLTRPNFRPEIV